MALRPPRISEAEDQNADSDRRAQPIRPVWQGALIWLFGIGLLLVVVGLAFGSSWCRPFRARARRQLPRLTSARSRRRRPSRHSLTAVPARVPTTAPTVAPTAVLVPAAAPTAQPQIATPARYDGTHTIGWLSAPSSGATSAPTVAPELAAEVSEAYLRYFQVSADALLRARILDGLDSVATGGELQLRLRRDRATIELQGRALETDVQHNFVVLSVQNDRGQVADRLPRQQLLC